MTENEHYIYIQEFLEGLELPATVVEIVSHAEDTGASEEVLDQLQAMPDRLYNTRQEILNHLGEVEPLPDHGHLEASSAQDLSGEAQLAREGRMPPGGPGGG